MRLSAIFLAAALGTASLPAQTTPVCTNLCLQQVAPGTCSAGQTTSISGVIYAPNGTDPLPNVQVYIPNAPVSAFTPGVSCPVIGTPPSGAPLVGTTTGVDGTFTITNVPVGTNIPLVFVSGRWRRQVVIPSTTSCANTVIPANLTNFPTSQAQGDIPLFAVATGSVDSVECVLRKVGVADSEFTDPAGTNGYVGRIQLYSGSGDPGARIGTSTPSQTQLMENMSTLNQYDVLMLPCQGGQYAQDSNSESNFDTFVNSGGRVYASHYSYVWMYYPAYTNGPFAGVANWQVNDGSYTNGTATINQSFAGGLTLAQWLQQPAIGASTTQGQIAISTLKHDLQAPNGVISPTQSWFTLNTTDNPVMQMVFDAPLITAANPAPNQCGRVLYNEYHVEAPVTSPTNVAFPNECVSGQAMTPQEKLLEFMLFELTDQGGAATLTPTTATFPNTPIGFSSASQAFTLTNNSTFAANNPTITIAGDFGISSNNCSTIAAGSSCTINVVYSPTVTGPETGTLSVDVGATSLLATLSGTGVADLSFPIPSLTFKQSVDVGATATQSFVITNTAPGPISVPVASPSGDFSFSQCGTLAASASCTITVTFKPTTTGTRTGTISVSPVVNGTTEPASTASVSGNGIDFTLTATPASAKVIAGDNVTFSLLTSPLAGFANNVTLTCATSVSGSTCAAAPASFSDATAATSTITITTTSEYSVIGFTGGFGSHGLWIIALLSGGFLFLARHRAGTIVRATLLLLLLAAATTAISGCSGKQPAKNSVYTAPGTYNYTVSATDGFLVHTASFSLTVTAN